MRLSRMFQNAPTTNITGLCFDSRKVKPGDMYFCLPGLTYDGHDFIDNALENGAIAIVHSRPVENKRPGAVYIRVKDVTEAMNQAARLFYSRPTDRMLMYGVTGTNGKSTITNIIRHFCNPELPCGYIGTIEIAYGRNHFTPNLTTPDGVFLQKVFKDMSDFGMKACAMEVSSHGLAQHRVDAIDYDVAVFSNFTYDHLDFHDTMDNYFHAKSLLFSKRVKPEGVSVFNADDPKCEELKNACVSRYVTYGIDNPADYQAKNVVISENGTTFDLHYQGKVIPFSSSMSGKFNVSNVLAAIAAVHESPHPVSLETLAEKARSIPQIKGRLEQIRMGQPFHVIVDFAHTPDGMEKMFKYGKSITEPGHSLIAVFGSAGKRDKPKRKVFGQLADQYCTSVFLTEDDPRDENPRDIAAEIKSGMEKVPAVFISERYEAIRQAIESANPGDTVLLLGKGDEPFMYHEEGRVPWKGDNVAARECIERLYPSSDKNDPSGTDMEHGQ